MDGVLSTPTSPSAFANTVREYVAHPSESIKSVLSDILNSNPFSALDYGQHCSVISSMSKLMTYVDSHDHLAWNVLQALDVYCSANKDCITLLQKGMLIPVLSKLTVSAMTDERKIQLLKVLEYFTYGVRVVRPDSFIAPLLLALEKWSKLGNKTVVQLSLSVLTNLIHRNPVVLTSLLRTVNLKEFMNAMLRCDMLCRMEVCKLMFLLQDTVYHKPCEEEVINFIKVSFCTLLDMSCQSTSQIEHCIDFFSDMVEMNQISSNHINNPRFLESFVKIIDLLESDSMNVTRAMLLFRFIKIFITMKIPTLESMHCKLMQQGVSWCKKYQAEAVEAIALINALLEVELIDGPRACPIPGLNEEDLGQVFLPLLEMEKKNHSLSFLSVLITFFLLVLDFDVYQNVLRGNLSTKIIESLLESLPEELHQANFSEDLVLTYVNIFHFVYKVVRCDGSWVRFYTHLCSERKVISALAVALMQGSRDLKRKVLSLVSNVGFPGESLSPLATLMAECGLRHSDTDSSEVLVPPSNALFLYDAENLLKSLKDSVKGSKEVNMTQIFYLYEHMKQINFDTEKSLTKSLSNATKQISMLKEEACIANQIRCNYLNELNNLQPAYHDIRNKLDAALALLDERDKEICDLRRRLTEELSSCQKTIVSLQSTVEQQGKEMEKHRQGSADLKSKLRTLMDTCATKEVVEKQLQKEIELLKEQYQECLKEKEQKADLILTLKEEIERLNTVVIAKGKEITLLEQDRNSKVKEIQELKRIKDMVFEITGGGKKV